MDLPISADLTPTRIVYCVARPERQIALARMLGQINVTAAFASSISDAMKTITQELPHFVLCDSEFPDGHACSLYDQLSRHPILKSIPIAVYVLKKTKEEIARVRERPFAIAYSDEQRPELLQRVLQKLLTLPKNVPAGVSPFFQAASNFPDTQTLSASISSYLVGTYQGMTLCLSEGEVATNDEMLGINKKAPEETFAIRGCESFETKEGMTSVIPTHRISGTGRMRLEALPHLNANSFKEDINDTNVYMIGAELNELGELAHLLKLHGVAAAASPVDTLNNDATPELLKKALVIYIDSLTPEMTKMRWRADLAKMPRERQPLILVGNESGNRKSSAALRFIRKPFSLNEFLDIIEVARTRKTDVFQVARSVDLSKALVLSFSITGELLGIDEAGALIGFTRMVQKGMRIDVQCPLLEAVWQHPLVALVTRVVPTPQDPNFACQVRIEPLQASGASKLKLIEKIQKVFETKGATHVAV